ncbi:hypothetical protein MWN34_18955 [Ancylobacter sp. 6x-1]|uniref:Uncharacterized protein n=1 Tax=Ancylobacter crimeensis TaxID=2579147 RepID=A0ABT0DGA0_9HYPH|nr:hypothetical protein [Ancylobacter crimeensis]MCK0198982.1 hypothetical protein [Ancylobacter crimeensis]
MRTDSASIPGGALDVQASALPALVERAASALLTAKSSAEVLEARDLAGLAYDAAKRAARLSKAKDAHDSLIAAAHRAQADALDIEAQAKRRLADEYDAAQERGEVAGRGGERSGREHSPTAPTASDIGLTRKAIHEARQVRDAEAADPGIVRRALDERLERGEEPTRAYMRGVVTDAMGRLRPSSPSRANPVYVAPSAAPFPAQTSRQPTEREKQIARDNANGFISSALWEIERQLAELPTPAECIERFPTHHHHTLSSATLRAWSAWFAEAADAWNLTVEGGSSAVRIVASDDISNVLFPDFGEPDDENVSSGMWSEVDAVNAFAGHIDAMAMLPRFSTGKYWEIEGRTGSNGTDAIRDLSKIIKVMRALLAAYEKEAAQ